MTTVTEDQMRLAMKKVLSEKGYTEAQIVEMADYVMGFFGFNDSIIDNKLTAKDRDIFYMLENEGLLKTASDEAHLKKGKLWRIHYWILNKKRIFELTGGNGEENREGESGSVYDSIPDEDWERH